MKPNNTFSMKMLSRSANEGFARAAVAAFIAQADPTIEELSDIKTAVSEAVTNCTVHAYGESLGNIYITAALYDGGMVKISVRDTGCGIPDIPKAMEPLYNSGGGERAGLGFAVMQSFMYKVSVRSKVGRGTTVTMQKRLSLRIR